MKPLMAKIYGIILFLSFLIRCNINTDVIPPTDVVSLNAENDLITLGTSELNLSDSVCYDITQQGIDGLIHMRIEEKLARDVYTVFGTIWNAQVFQNIKASEQKHMDAVKNMLDKYSISDPLLTDEVGIFPDTEFQALYEQYITQGIQSLYESLLFGAEIEEHEIADLENQLTNVVVKPCIINLYTNLKDASVSHLLAFEGNI